MLSSSSAFSQPVINWSTWTCKSISSKYVCLFGFFPFWKIIVLNSIVLTCLMWLLCLAFTPDHPNIRVVRCNLAVAPHCLLRKMMPICANIWNLAHNWQLGTHTTLGQIVTILWDNFAVTKNAWLSCLHFFLTKQPQMNISLRSNKNWRHKVTAQDLKTIF